MRTLSIAITLFFLADPLFPAMTAEFSVSSNREKAETQQLSRPESGERFVSGNLSLVQVLGKVQRPGNYPGNLPLSVLIAEAMDRAPGSNFKVHLYNAGNGQNTSLRYEEIVQGEKNPVVPPGSIVYFPASASSLFGEMMEKQMNLFYLIVITLSALGISAIAKQ